MIESDEGYTLNAAWQLWTGSRMYDDFRLFVGPGSGYCVFWLWKLLGSASHSAARLLAVGFSFSSTVALYLLLRRIGVRGAHPGAHGGRRGCSSARSMCPSITTRSVATRRSGSCSRSCAWSKRRPRQAAGGAPAPIPALAGLAAAVTFLFLPTKGALLAGAAAAYLFARGFRARVLRAPLVLSGVFVAVIALLLLRWRPAPLVRQWLIIPLTGNYLGHTSASRPYSSRPSSSSGQWDGARFG